jgi:hypothetical protein
VVEPFKVPTFWRFWCALDYGFSHYTVVHLFAQDVSDGMIYTIGEHAERHWLVSRHAEAIKAMLARHGVSVGQLEAFVAGADVFNRHDGKSIADQYEECGIDLSAANMDRVNGAAEVLLRLGDTEAGIAPSVRIFSTCGRLIETIPILEHDPHRPEDVLKIDCDENGIGGDDAYDAWRYGLMARASNVKVFVY